MKTLSIEQEQLMRTLSAIGITDPETAKQFITEADQEKVGKIERLVSAYSGLAGRFYDLLPEESEDPNNFPEMMVMRDVIKAIFSTYSR